MYQYGPHMKRFYSQCRRWHLAIGVLAPLWLVNCTRLALAQEADEAVVKENWSLSYLAVVLLIALGLIGVCRPGRRLKEIREEEE